MNPTRAIFIQAMLFLVVVFAGFVCIVYSFTTQASKERFAGTTFGQIADGTFTKSVDTQVADALPKSDRLDGLQAGLEYRTLDDAGPQVRAGCSGWLFLTEEVLEVKGGYDHLRMRSRIAAKIVADFAKRGIRVVMLPVPDKARMAADERCRQQYSPQSQGRWAEWDRVSADIPTPRIDIVNGWPGKPGYWRTDTHWDDNGARYAAKLTAEQVIALLGDSGNESATVRQASTATVRPGDLLHLSNIGNAPRALQPPPDMERAVTVSWQHTGGLFDAGPAASVILAGSSYSENSGFADDLGLDLRREVVQMSEAGGGFDGAILDTLEKHPGVLSQAKVVVWEFPERSLTQPITDRERAFMKLAVR